MVNNSKTITILAIAIFAISLASVGVFYLSARSLMSSISGYATSTGEANLTVETIASINFTTAHINWGSGRVTTGFSSAYLNSEETNNVTNGNWTLQTPGGLRIENNGNVNVSLEFWVTKVAATFIGGTSPNYTWKFTTPETLSCLNASGGTGNSNLLNTYSVAIQGSQAGEGLQVCDIFRYINTNDSLRIDFNLTIPSDSLTGQLGDTLTAYAIAV